MNFSSKMARRVSSTLVAAGLVAATIVPWSAVTGTVNAIANTESVYVTGRINQMMVFDGSTQTLSSTLAATAATGQFNGIVASHDQSMVWRTSMSEGKVYGFSTVTDTLLKTYSAPGDVRAIQISPDDQYLYASNLAGTIYKIRVSDGVNVLTISNGSGTYGMGISSDGAYLYVPNNSSNVVSKVRTSDGTVVGTVSTGTGAGTRWVDAKNGYIVATNYSTNKVSVIDESSFTELGQVVTGTNPIGIAFNPAGTVAYVAAERSNRVEVIDLVARSTLRTVGVGNRPWGVAVNSTGSRVYAGTYMVNSMYVISTSAWTYSTVSLASDQTMTIAVVSAPATMPTTTTTSTTTTSTTTTTVAPTTTTTLAPTTTPAPTTTTTVVPQVSTTSTTSTVAAGAPVASQSTVASQASVPASADSGQTTPVASTVPVGPTASSMPLARSSSGVTTTSSTTSSTTTTMVLGPQAPDASPGEAVATANGKVVDARVTRLDNALVVDSGEVQATVYGLDSNGQRIALNTDGNLALETGQSIVVEAKGYEPGTGVEVWLHSNPVQLGTITVNGLGIMKGSFVIPASVPTGDHRVLLSGSTRSGVEAVIGVGLRIGEYGKESGVNKVLITFALLPAVGLALVIPTTARRRRRARN